MKNVISVVLLLMCIGCNNVRSIKETSWILSDEDSNATLIFSDSTYTAEIFHDGVHEQNEFSYTINGDSIYFQMTGSTSFKGVIKDNNLIIYQSELIELPDTSFTEVHEIIYKRR